MRSLAFALSLSLLPLAAHAAEPPVMAAMMKERFGGMMGRGAGGFPPHLAAEYPAGYKAFLQTELAITPKQQGAFEAYLAAAKPKDRASFEAVRKALREQKPLPDKMAERIQRTEEYLGGLKKRQAALEDLYKQLDEVQKKKADSLLGW